jgi:hypothetical protein
MGVSFLVSSERPPRFSRLLRNARGCGGSILTRILTGLFRFEVGSGAHGGCDRSAEEAYSSAAPDPTFAFVGGPYCPTLDFIFTFWIMVTLSTLTLLFCIVYPYTIDQMYTDYYCRNLYTPVHRTRHRLLLFSHARVLILIYHQFVAIMWKCRTALYVSL